MKALSNLLKKYKFVLSLLTLVAELVAKIDVVVVAVFSVVSLLSLLLPHSLAVICFKIFALASFRPKGQRSECLKLLRDVFGATPVVQTLASLLPVLLSLSLLRSFHFRSYKNQNHPINAMSNKKKWLQKFAFQNSNIWRTASLWQQN